jgi:pimeloyl-ACP methyl ester carboxylesterase
MAKQRPTPPRLLKNAASLLLTAAGGWIVYSQLLIDHAVPLPPAVAAERTTFVSARAGQVSYYADRRGSGRPLLLLHSINAAPSVYEVKPLFEHYQGRRPVLALDLPGFGFSERGPRAYSPELYAQTISEFLVREGGEAADVVALSLSSEFVARAALARPALFHSITMISPTGFGVPGGTTPHEYAQRSKIFNRAGKVVAFPPISQPIYDLLTTQASIRYYLSKNLLGEPPADFVEYGYATTHQPGARYAPLAFLSGRLFTWDAITSLYPPLTVPTLVIYDRDPNIRFDMLPGLLSQNQNWRAVQLAPTLGLPHWEKLPETVATLEEFWERAWH